MYNFKYLFTANKINLYYVNVNNKFKFHEEKYIVIKFATDAGYRTSTAQINTNHPNSFQQHQKYEWRGVRHFAALQ